MVVQLVIPALQEAWIQGQLVLYSVNTFKLIILLPKIVRSSSFHLLQVHVFFFNRCFKWKIFSLSTESERQQSENCHTDICIFIKHLSNWQKWLPNSTMSNSIWSNNLINATYQIRLYKRCWKSSHLRLVTSWPSVSMLVLKLMLATVNGSSTYNTYMYNICNNCITVLNT